MKIALLITLTLSYKQTIAGCCGKKNKSKVTVNCKIKESMKDVNVEEVKGEHMVKHIYTAKDDKRIIKIKVGQDNAAKDMNDKSYISSVEVYRSNRREMIYLIKLVIKTSSEDVIIYLYEFFKGWRIVEMGFVHYIIGKLERGENFEYPIYTTQKEGTSFTSSAIGTDVNIKFEAPGTGSSTANLILTAANKLKLKLYTYRGNAERSFDYISS